MLKNIHLTTHAKERLYRLSDLDIKKDIENNLWRTVYDEKYENYVIHWEEWRYVVYPKDNSILIITIMHKVRDTKDIVRKNHKDKHKFKILTKKEIKNIFNK